MNDWSDDELMAALAEAMGETDAVTERRRSAAQSAFTWRTVDEELMDLLHDSALEAGAAVRSAGEATERVLSFGRGELSLELEVSGDAVLGQVVPGQRGTVALQRLDADPRTVETDGAGFFRIEGVAPGLVRFVVTTATETLTTPWVDV
jgi:hypothetical protein